MNGVVLVFTVNAIFVVITFIFSNLIIMIRYDKQGCCCSSYRLFAKQLPLLFITFSWFRFPGWHWKELSSI